MKQEIFSSNSGKPVRVLFVSHDGGMAGAQTTLLTLLRGLDRQKTLPYLVVPYIGLLGNSAIDINIPVFIRKIVHWIPCADHLNDGKIFKYFLNSVTTLRERVWAIAALVERYEIDLVYTNTVTCVEGAVAAYITGKPHVWHIHEPMSNNSELLPLPLPSGFYRRLISALSKSVIFPSKSVSNLYSFDDRLASVVYNGLPLSKPVDRAVARDNVGEHLNLDKSKRWVAVVGALQPRKDHLTFVRAAVHARAEYGDALFLIVGTGPDECARQIQEEIDKHNLQDVVKMVGRWPFAIAEFLNAVDVLAISSEQESFGLTIIEAFAVGAPVVSTRCGGPEEIIEDGVNGFLVPLKDSVALSNAIVSLLKNPDMARTFGEKGQDMVNRRFTEKHYVEGIQKVIFDAVNHPKQ